MDTQRLLDVALLTAAAPAWLPATAVVATAVLVADGPPVLFRQERLGRDRRPFTVLKLRTMTTETDARDRRPTRVGGWLRHRGLDELPQLLNIARGDMSLVGPRPLTAADADRLCAQHPPYARRFAVRPGLTGPAQVHQRAGVVANADLDLGYVEGRSAVGDLGVLARTAWINLVGKRLGRVGGRLGRLGSGRGRGVG